jgi:hypothetical protein
MRFSARRKSWLSACALGLISTLTTFPVSAADTMARPQDGVVGNGAYTNAYFHLNYPLPAGWTTGLAGPEPSPAGYYVLNTFVPEGEFNGSILVAAQDLFFAPRPFNDPLEMVDDIARDMSEIEGVTVDQAPTRIEIAGRRFARVDTSGFGLFRSTFVTEIRCHLVSFNFSANRRELFDALTASLSKLSADAERAQGADPVCTKGHARSDNVVARVNPPAIAPLNIPIPVRLVIAADGSVRHVNAIRATKEQRGGIETALAQWKFKPFDIDGRAIDIETGLFIQFTPSGEVSYTTALRRRTTD